MVTRLNKVTKAEAKPSTAANEFYLVQFNSLNFTEKTTFEVETAGTEHALSTTE